ncbi:MAG TPA: hypothetical protein VK686_07885, partial [Bryobacteraceae bacterium]|nr:hypothetical protein [Bryobacteraceae bacterium]
MIVSAPAPAALPLPAHALTKSLDSKASLLNANSPLVVSTTADGPKVIPFKNVFDSLTLFDDLEQESGAQQGSAGQANV